jgi:hypothetical protein
MPNVDLDQIVAAIAAAQTVELMPLGMKAVYTEVPGTIEGELPVIFTIESALGSTFDNLTLSGGPATIGGGPLVAGSQEWTHHLEQIVLVVARNDATSFRLAQQLGRKWTTLVPEAFQAHYDLGGLVYTCEVKAVRPTPFELSDGKYWAKSFLTIITHQVEVLLKPG